MTKAQKVVLTIGLVSYVFFVLVAYRIDTMQIDNTGCNNGSISYNVLHNLSLTVYASTTIEPIQLGGPGVIPNVPSTQKTESGPCMSNYTFSTLSIGTVIFLVLFGMIYFIWGQSKDGEK